MVRLVAVLLLVGCSAASGGADAVRPSESDAGAPTSDAGEPAVGGTASGSAGVGGLVTAAGAAVDGGSTVEPEAGKGGRATSGSGGGGTGPVTAGAGGSSGSGGAAGAHAMAGSAGTGGGCPAFDCLTAEQCVGPGFTSTSTAPVYNTQTKCFEYKATCFPADLPEACVPAKCWRAEQTCP